MVGPCTYKLGRFTNTQIYFGQIIAHFVFGITSIQIITDAKLSVRVASPALQGIVTENDTCMRITGTQRFGGIFYAITHHPKVENWKIRPHLFWCGAT